VTHRAGITSPIAYELALQAAHDQDPPEAA